jgi:demethylmenaquinone methyltransferase/2-methoxy-6-polyprenyl-1,4-benzoquinol methylase
MFKISMFLLVPLVVAFLTHYFVTNPVETPPSDFGSGSMFDQIATRYDLINRVLALRMDVSWRQQMANTVKQRVVEASGGGVSALEPQLLDVATGTADVALTLAKTIPSAKILGLDPSNNMLNVGRKKIQQQGLLLPEQKIRLEWADARDLNVYPASTFDGATMAFGIRNVPEREVALCQIHRLLKPNSVFCILEFSEPDDSFGFLGALARLFIRHVVPVIGGVLSGKPREYLHLQNSIKDFPSPPEFGILLEGLSCGGAGGGTGHFHVDEIVQMNFGSVQLYVTTAAVAREETLVLVGEQQEEYE